MFAVGHPSPAMKSISIPKCDLSWKHIGSGVYARTFIDAQHFITTTKDGPHIGDVSRRVTRCLGTGRVIDDCSVDDTADHVLNRSLSTRSNIRVELTMHGSLQMYQAKGADISDINFQPRVVQEAAMREYDGLRLQLGWSLDLTVDDPRTKMPWDFSKHEVRERVWKLVRDTKPFMLVGSPPCTALSALQGLSKHKGSGGSEKGNGGSKSAYEVLPRIIHDANQRRQMFHA